MTAHLVHAGSDGFTPEPGLQVGVPLGFVPETPSGVTTGSSGESRGTNTPRSSSSPGGRAEAVRGGRRRRISSRTLHRLGEEMSERDGLVLARLWEHRYLTTRQLQRFCFTGHATDESAARTTRRVVARLHRDRLIRPLARRVGGVRAGSDARVWQLAPAGARIARPETGRSWRTHEPSERFLAHTLAVADVHLALRDGQAHGYEVDVQVEPLSWRRFSGLGGESRLVRPDLTTTVHGHDEHGSYEDRWFVEVDMGTESLPTLLTKCRLYMDYYRSGSEQASHGSFPQVLWTMHGPRAKQRADALQQRVLRTPSLEPRLFRIVTTDHLDHALWGDPTTNPERKEAT